MKVIAALLALLMSTAAIAQNYGGGPGNSGPGDKNGQNNTGHGGQPDGGGGTSDKK